MMDWHYTITPKMVALGLRGNELLAYAVIDGFSQNGAGCYLGSVSYLCEVTGMAHRTAVETLKHLTERGLLKKEERIVDKVRRCYYQTAGGVVQNLHYPMQNLHGGGAESAPNNKLHNTPLVVSEYISNDISSSTTSPQGDRRPSSAILSKFVELGCDAQTLADWRAARKGAPITQAVLDGMQREAKKAGITLAEAVRICAENSWRGFRADYLHNGTGKGERTVMQGVHETYEKLFGEGGRFAGL